MHFRMMTVLAIYGILTGCGHSDGPVGGVGAEEAAQLDNAAEMLDAGAPGSAGNAGP